MEKHPITPPPELLEQWAYFPADWHTVALLIAQWGADQELEACCEWLKAKHWIEPEFADELRAARRPKPPSLKEQAMQVLLKAGFTLDGNMELEPEDIDIIHRALEQLDD
jgi:hypothetical protein